MVNVRPYLQGAIIRTGFQKGENENTAHQNSFSMAEVAGSDGSAGIGRSRTVRDTVQQCDTFEVLKGMAMM